jgi:hypothetical protein
VQEEVLVRRSREVRGNLGAGAGARERGEK